MTTTTEKLKYLKRYTDRFGVKRIYFNKLGAPKVALPGPEGSPEFLAAYHLALAASKPYAPPEPIERPDPGTLSDLIGTYYRSTHYRTLSPVTQYSYRSVMEPLRRKHGKKPIALLDRQGVMLLIGEKADRPGAANKLLRNLRLLMGFAIEIGMRNDDPTARVKKLKVPGDGFVAWSDQDIEQFEGKHPIGTRARLAHALLLYTAQRRGDVIRMGRKDIRGGKIKVRQGKTGTTLEIPVHPDLSAILRTAPVGPETFLITRAGEPFSPYGFGNWFGDCCREAGLPLGHNAHGLRKAAARRLAEVGCSTLEIMSITGHKTIEEVERYTRAVSQSRLAQGAISKLSNRVLTS